MSDRLSPPVPELSDHWIAIRRAHLIDEVTAKHQWRPSRRTTLGGLGALATTAAAVIAGILLVGGVSAPNAFAGWQSSPTPAASGQTDTAQSTCREQLATAPSSPGGKTIDLASLQLALADTRGPFSTQTQSTKG